MFSLNKYVFRIHININAEIERSSNHLPIFYLLIGYSYYYQYYLKA